MIQSNCVKGSLRPNTTMLAISSDIKLDMVPYVSLNYKVVNNWILLVCMYQEGFPL